MTPETDIPTLAAAHSDGAFVIDVREPTEYVEGHVPGALLVPLSTVINHVTEFPRDRRIFVICRSGNRSRGATDLLNRLGFDAVSVAGGTVAWMAHHLPVVTGLRAA